MCGGGGGGSPQSICISGWSYPATSPAVQSVIQHFHTLFYRLYCHLVTLCPTFSRLMEEHVLHEVGNKCICKKRLMDAAPLRP